ncbi:MAG: hypothetical protein HC819_21740 [Cyclobacteriaceae bacterium]|nr:hypothetical protein [Cyclobacteriaceae bacterium]
MKKISNYLFLLLAGSLIFLYSCKDDDDPIPVPTVTAPTGVLSVENEATGQTVNFTVSVADGLTATWAATGTNVTLTETSGTVSGTTVAVGFDATATAGAGSIALTITDSEGQKASATAVINVLAPGDAPITFNTNGKLPATASVTIGQTLTVSGVDVASADGVKEVTATVNGTAAPALTTTYTGSPSTAEYGFSVNTTDLGEGTFVIVFTAVDDNGSTASFSHALTVNELAFNVTEETDADGKVLSREISGSINSDYTFTNDAEWILAGRIKVIDGATLTIEKGSLLKGRSGGGQNATALLIARGSKIMAEGTATEPIIMTAESDNLSIADIKAGNFKSPNLAPDVNGQWGGFIVLGDAPISTTNENKVDVTEAQIEGIPSSDEDGLFGGTNKTDNSGVIKYVSIRHGGTNIGSGNEINGLTLGGVGSGTVIENIEVVANQDDGIEWFGGTVSVSNVVVWNTFDDGLDTDYAWNGTCSNFIIITPNTGSGFELDGPEGTYKDGNHKFIKGTVYAGADIADLIDFDDKSNVDMSDIYFYGITTGTKVTEYKKMVDAGNGSVATFQYSNIADPAAVFVDIPADKYTEVNTNENTVGVKDQTGFEWTWASQSGKLAEIGL